MSNSQYVIGANDEHGQNPFTAGKRTPILPYINRPFYENEFNRPTKNKFIEAALRNGFTVFDVKPELTDVPISMRTSRVNRRRLTALVTFAYNAFGSGNTFNSASGITTYYGAGINSARSRQLAEEVYESLLQGTGQRGRGVEQLSDVGVLSSVNCPSALIEAGFMTNLFEATLMLDWNYHTEVGEEALEGVTRYLGVEYIPRTLQNHPTLRRGKSDNFVALLQFILQNYGYTLALDGAFGPATEAAVRRYQQDNGLSVDGIVGPATWQNLLFLPPYPTLRSGSRGTYVKYLQSKLLTKLYDPGAVDGIFGAKTASALAIFQRDNALMADSIAGPATWSVLSKIGGART